MYSIRQLPDDVHVASQFLARALGQKFHDFESGHFELLRPLLCWELGQGTVREVWNHREVQFILFTAVSHLSDQVRPKDLAVLKLCVALEDRASDHPVGLPVESTSQYIHLASSRFANQLGHQVKDANDLRQNSLLRFFPFVEIEELPLALEQETGLGLLHDCLQCYFQLLDQAIKQVGCLQNLGQWRLQRL